ncbi:uncharacterized protein LOC124439411 [Xenia sp. Carnegie-2017]|uniref:uncharacterized protein LOC124439411 n=1 Tax=Xenia sp. Carnegie-2017 TaxID=2897299 RepID=UPI001F034C41|nr:uncharacterized protein LOC124439411 [Xenia sp. Carnegie-2017]
MILNDEDRAKDSETRKEDAFSVQRNKFRGGKQRGDQNENILIERKAFVARNKSAQLAENEENSEINNGDALISNSSNITRNSDWIIDSGATQHMTYDLEGLCNYVEFKQPCLVNLGDNRSILAYGKGTYKVKAILGDGNKNISLQDVIVFT